MSQNSGENVFRAIDTYKQSTTSDSNKLFLNVICTEQCLGSINNLTSYINATSEYDNRKKVCDVICNSNERTLQKCRCYST